MVTSISEIQEEFLELESPEERIQFLIELGQTLPPFPSEYCTEQYRVLGCQSMVWFVPTWEQGRLQFQATSDAPMVRGLAAVLVSAYSDKTPVEVLQYPVEQVFDGLKLRSFLSPLRSNGLHSMIRRIREYASETLPSVSDTQTSSSHLDLPDFGPVRDKLESIRRDFPVLSVMHSEGLPVAYLDNAASSQRPVSVIGAMDSVYREHYANVHRSGHEFAAQTTERIEASRAIVRDFIHAKSAEEVIFTSGTTASINLIAQSWGRTNLKQGDEILLSEMEHHSNIVPWQQLVQETGCRIRWIPIRDDYQLNLDSYKTQLTERVKLVACTAVSNVLGTINPVRDLVAMAHAVGATVLIDAAQATPHGAIDVQAWDADFAVFSGHKMLAASGVGVCYGKRSLLESMPPWLGGGNMIKSVSFDGFEEAAIPHKFEAGTPPIVEIISMKPAIEYLSRIGGQRLMEHERELAKLAIDGLQTIPGVRVFSPPIESKAGIVSFVVDGVHSEELSRMLDARGIAIRSGHHCAMPLHQKLGVNSSSRASFAFYNTEDEVSRFVSAVRDGIVRIRR